MTGRLRHTTEIKTIDIQRIRKAEILDETYTIPDNLKAFFSRENGAKLDTRDMIPLTLRIRERSVLNVFRYLTYTDLEIGEQEADGSLICTVKVENSIELFLRIVQCGTSVEVLEPGSYRAYIQEQVNKIAELYRSNSA